MGEIADDMIDGLTCSMCGVCFVRAHGYPVLCRGCWTPGCGQQKAIELEI